MGLLPAVVAARGDVDPHTFHEQGRLTEAAVRVYDTLLAHRRLTTGELRNMAGLSGSGGRQQFEKATVSLNALFQICKVEITGRHLSTYSYVWGLMEDWGPEVLRAAARLRPAEAAGEVAGRLASVGVAMSPREWKRLFGWDDEVLPQ